MRVGELEELLARLPDDMLIGTYAGRGAGLYHVGVVDKRPRRRYREQEEDAPPFLVMQPGWPGVLWFEPEPAFELRGNWPRPKPPRELVRP